MKYILFFTFILFLPFHPCRAHSKHEFIYAVDSKSYDLFSTFDAVLHLLLYYDKGHCTGVEVDFRETGLYYDRARGSNWWSYFFEPLCKGNPDDGLMIPCSLTRAQEIRGHIDNFCRRDIFNKIIKKFIRIKPALRKKAQEFFVKNCQGLDLIGVHYHNQGGKRRVPFDHMSQEVREYIKENKLKNYRLFISTNDQAFINFMRLIFPNHILHLTGHRSLTLSPTQPKANCIQAERELIDCLLLAKCKVLIQTPTQLGLWASRFNTTLPLVIVDGHKQQPYISY